MLAYTMRRVLFAALAGVTGGVIVFLLMLGTGDPIGRVLSRPGVPMGTAQRVTSEFNLDAPLPRRFATWVGDVAKGDLGTSVSTQESVATALGESWAPTAQLIGMASLASLALALILGTASARRAGSSADRFLKSVFAVGVSVPVFGWALLLGGNRTAGIIALMLAATPLTIAAASALGTFHRLETVLYLESAAAISAETRGVTGRRVVWRHALRAAPAPLLRHAGLGVGLLIGTVVLVELALGIPGLGTGLVDALDTGDVPLAVGFLLVLIGFAVVLRMLFDVCAGWFDPDVRHGSSS